MARKADLRPSPISSILTSDLLTFRADFHINYLPEIISTFSNLFSSRSALEIEEFDLENLVKPAVQLDGQIASEDSRVLLLEAARRAAFRANNLYFPDRSDLAMVTGENLNQFHLETLERSANNGQFSFLLSVNDAKLINSEQLSSLIKSCGIETAAAASSSSNPLNSAVFNEGKSVRIELNDAKCNEFMFAFNIPSGGFSQKDHMLTFIIESLLKKKFPSAMASVTADTSLLTLHFKFDAKESSSKIRGKLEEIVKELRSIPETLKEEELTWAQERAKFNRSLAIETRDTRLLTFAHHLAFSAPLPTNLTSLDNAQVRNVIKKVFQGSKPVLVGRGNYKKIPQYEELF